MTTDQRLDKQIADLKEMELSLSGIGNSMTNLIRERDYFKDENQRLQLEVARLRLAQSEAVNAMTRVSKLNPKCSEIGAGMLLTIIEECIAALVKLEGDK